MSFAVTNLISGAFSLASSQQSDVKEVWISISHGVGSRLSDSLLVASIQKIGDLDVLLRCMEEERAQCVSRPQDFEEAVHLTLHYQVLFSEVWISSTYEICRLLKCRGLIGEVSEFLDLEHDLRLIRVPIDKHEIAKDKKLKEPLKFGKLNNRGDVKDYCEYVRDDPRRAHIMGAGITLRGSVIWNALDVDNIDKTRWLERLNLSERTISVLHTYTKQRLQESGVKI